MRKMRALRAPHVRFALLLGTAFALASPASAQLGTVTHADAEMPVEDAVAVWDPERPQLRLYLFPFELTPAEIVLCRSDDAHEIRRDPEKWPNGTPRAFYTLNWWGPEGAGDPQKATLAVRAQNILGGNVSAEGQVRLDCDHEGVEQTLEGKLQAGAEIHLQARGETKVGDALVRWDLEIRTELLSPEG